MKNICKKSLIPALLVMILSGISWAEEGQDIHDLEKIIVTATRTEASQYSTGSSATVITAEEVGQTGKDEFSDLLRDVPGVTVSQSGSIGGLTNVYLRGSKPGHTLVMVDGVELNDPMSTDRSFDFSNLTMDNIERIEVIRGPQSALYGSDAMAGVINIITKKGRGKPEFSSSFEGGAHNTFRENLTSSGNIDKFNYSLSVSRLDSGGISAAAGGSEKDPYHNNAISSRIGYKVFDNSELSLVARYTNSKTSIDNGAYDDDPNDTLWSKDLATRLAFDQAINYWWNHCLSFSYNDVRRKGRNDKDPSHPDDYSSDWYKGNIKKVEWQHNISPAKWNTLTAGFEYERESGSSYYESDSSFGPFLSKQDRKSVDNKGYYFQDQFKFWEKLFITPGLRIDDHELFGAETTYKISAAYLIPQTGTRLKGNWGTGFKAPSLYQLYSSYGDTSLKPDKSRSYDFGFEQSFFKDKLSFDLAYFHNDFRNLVDYDYNTNKYKNIGRASTKGFEVGAKFSPVENLTIGGNFTYTDTQDKETGLELLRRPKRQFNFDLNWGFLPNANLNLGLNHVGSRKDYVYITDKSYTIVRLASSYNVTKNFQIFGRIENLFDKEYQEVNGYATLGRSFYGGIKGKF
ncbi:MAG: TonB-dependent receptor [Candidatus Omnitrophica bacterium]|nr:TonB-dependent receptor [Candidatus Omnitrophota bacterium]